MKARIGFIGSGSRASAYAINLKKTAGLEAEYTAICDVNPEFRQRFNEFYADGKASLYSDYREMLERHTDLDGVVICTPDY
ncbi:MAG: Gfo/Idh/MocA family oxidoreductase, partial [bacterium]|nr:Gfo/Idh/MocA family oxidoreductase [bacterium]